MRDGKIIQLEKKDLNRLDKCEDTKKQQTCDYGKHFVAINVNSEVDDRGQRLTLEEIKQLPRFKDYEAGEPSQVNVHYLIGSVLQFSVSLLNFH